MTEQRRQLCVKTRLIIAAGLLLALSGAAAEAKGL